MSGVLAQKGSIRGLTLSPASPGSQSFLTKPDATATNIKPASQPNRFSSRARTAAAKPNTVYPGLGWMADAPASPANRRQIPRLLLSAQGKMIDGIQSFV